MGFLGPGAQNLKGLSRCTENSIVARIDVFSIGTFNMEFLLIAFVMIGSLIGIILTVHAIVRAFRELVRDVDNSSRHSIESRST